MVGKRVFPFGMVTFHGRAVKLREGRYRKGTGTNAVSCCFFWLDIGYCSIHVSLLCKEVPRDWEKDFSLFFVPPLDGTKIRAPVKILYPP